MKWDTYYRIMGGEPFLYLIAHDFGDDKLIVDQWASNGFFMGLTAYTRQEFKQYETDGTIREMKEWEIAKFLLLTHIYT